MFTASALNEKQEKEYLVYMSNGCGGGTITGSVTGVLLSQLVQLGRMANQILYLFCVVPALCAAASFQESISYAKACLGI